MRIGTTRPRMQTEEEATRTGWHDALCRVASRERKWRSWLNGNGRWFVRQNSFSGFAWRSFSRQLRGEKEIGEKGHLLLAGLPTRLCFPSALLYSSYLRFSFLRFLFLPCSFSLRTFVSQSRSAATRHMDAHEERLLREKGLGNRLRDSLPSLNEWEILHTAHRAGFLSLSLSLSFFVSPSTLLPSSFASAISLLFFHLSRGSAPRSSS